VNILIKLRRILDRPSRLVIGVVLRYARLFNDQKALVYGMYWLSIGKKPNLKNPTTFNEKINWLKLHDHNPKYHILVDKFAVKDYVTNVIGKEYIIPTLGIWNTFDEIDFDSLPDQFVLKTTNGGGNSGIVICRNKREFDKADARVKLHKSMAYDIYKNMGEWAYKGIKPRIMAETFMEDNTHPQNVDLIDYKFYCFNGNVKFFKIDFDRNTKHRANYYNRNADIQEFGELICLPDFDKKLDIPINLSDMIGIAEKLSADLLFSRIDLYNINGSIYFGEITFYPNSGNGKFVPKEWDLILGNYLKIR
jgi:hypothetical protein